MPVTINGSNTPTAGGVTYGDGTQYATTSAGSAGGVLYSAGSSAPAFTAAGTAGYLLQSNGSSAPSWVAAPSSAMTLLATVNPTSGTYVTFDGYFTSAYDVYLVTGSNITSSFADNLRSQIAIASTFQTGAFYKQTETVIANNATTTTVYSQTTGSRIDMTSGGSISTNNGGLCCYIYNPLNTAGPKVISFSVFGTDGSGVLRQSVGTASYSNSSAAMSGIRFYFASADWSAGSLQLYGLKNS